MSDDPQDRGAVLEPAAEAGRSLVDRIRERNERRDPHIDLPIPRWNGEVIVRFGRISPKQLQAASRRRGARASNAELLVSACREIFLVDDQTGDLVPASQGDGQAAPIRFDGRLADLFGITAATPRDIVFRMYGDDLAIGAHAKDVFDWQTGKNLDDLTPEEVDEDAGEEGAAT